MLPFQGFLLLNLLAYLTYRLMSPDSAIESYLESLGRPFRSEANRFVPRSGPPRPVHGVPVSKQAR